MWKTERIKPNNDLNHVTDASTSDIKCISGKRVRKPNSKFFDSLALF